MFSQKMFTDSSACLFYSHCQRSSGFFWDSSDFEALTDFSRKIAEKILNNQEVTSITYDRDTPVGPYYTPLKTDHTPARFLKAKPVTDMNKCNNCGICVRKCPMGSISADDPADISGICIKCQACVRFCPTHA